jgi:hypothetical protein
VSVGTPDARHQAAIVYLSHAVAGLVCASETHPLLAKRSCERAGHVTTLVTDGPDTLQHGFDGILSRCKSTHAIAAVTVPCFRFVLGQPVLQQLYTGFSCILAASAACTLQYSQTPEHLWHEGELTGRALCTSCLQFALAGKRQPPAPPDIVSQVATSSSQLLSGFNSQSRAPHTQNCTTSDGAKGPPP